MVLGPWSKSNPPGCAGAGWVLLNGNVPQDHGPLNMDKLSERKAKLYEKVIYGPPGTLRPFLETYLQNIGMGVPGTLALRCVKHNFASCSLSGKNRIFGVKAVWPPSNRGDRFSFAIPKRI